MVNGETYDKDDAQFFGQSPFQCVRVGLVGWVDGCGLRIAQGCGAALLFDKGVGDEAIDDRWVD